MTSIPVGGESERVPAARAGAPTLRHEAVLPARRVALVSATERLRSLDAYRGFIMLVMVSGGLGLAKVFGPSDGIWYKVAEQTQHVPWIGGVFWDMIQPAFMFMVGVALPFSVARRVADGQSFAWRLLHTIFRSVVLVALGVMLASKGQPQTNFLFTNVLAQIGLGYTFVFLLTGRGLVLQFVALAAILAGDWAAMNFHKVNTPEQAYVDPSTSPISKALEPERMAVWRPHVNMAADFDRWFLNRFRRAERYEFTRGGYQTLSFVPSIATMLLGVMIGELLLSARGKAFKLFVMIVAGALCLAGGLLLGGAFETPLVCPIVKRIWTPAWVLYSGAWVIWMLAGFYLVIDVMKLRAWSFPLMVVGMNSIFMYLMALLVEPWIRSTLTTHFGKNLFDVTIDGVQYGPIVEACTVLFILWLACLYLYKQKAFLRI